jgi:hypothetical protein
MWYAGINVQNLANDVAGQMIERADSASEALANLISDLHQAADSAIGTFEANCGSFYE